MKLLLVSPHYPPRFLGGVELCTQRLAHRFRAEGHEVSVVAVERLAATQSEPLQVDADDDAGVRVFRLAVATAADDSRFEATYHDRHVEAWLTSWLRREQPDVVHLHSGYLLGGAVLAAARAVGVPVVVTLHDFWFICPRVTLLHPDRTCCTGPETPLKCAWCLATEQRRYRLPEQALGRPAALQMARVLAVPPLAAATGLADQARRIELRRQALFAALDGAAAITAPSRFLRDEMARAGFPAQRVDHVRYGVEPRRLAPRRPADQVAVRIGFLGQIAPHKGVHVLVDAVRRLPDAPIELVVHGPLDREVAYVETLRQLAAADPRIQFAGPIGHDMLDAFLARLDILAVPSVWYENSPFVIHEARTAGLPVLASRLGGMAELVEDGGDGLLAEAGSPASFAAAIDRLVREPDLAQRLRAGVRQPPTLDDEVRDLTAIYQRVAAPQPEGVR
jgi:glycosyltransferase involved in cell wall biosynthesis